MSVGVTKYCFWVYLVFQIATEYSEMLQIFKTVAHIRVWESNFKCISNWNNKDSEYASIPKYFSFLSFECLLLRKIFVIFKLFWKSRAPFSPPPYNFVTYELLNSLWDWKTKTKSKKTHTYVLYLQNLNKINRRKYNFLFLFVFFFFFICIALGKNWQKYYIAIMWGKNKQYHGVIRYCGNIILPLK